MNRYKQVEHMLRYYKMTKANIENLKKDIEFASNDISLTGIDYTGISTSPTNKISSTTENAALSIIDKVSKLEREVLANQLEIDRINRSLEALEEKEYSIIKGYYIDSEEWYEVAYRVGYSERHCKRLRNNAVNKLVRGILGNKDVLLMSPSTID